MAKPRQAALADLKEDLAVERVSLAEVAAERLRELILLQKLAPGCTLSERELSERLQISRTPLREAIRQLTQERLIEIPPNRRPQVADPSPTHIDDLFDVQATLEALSGRLFCQRASDEQIREVAEMQRQLNAIAMKEEPMTFFRLDMEFHCRIVHGTANAALAETHRQYNAALFRARFMSSKQMRWRDVTLAEHDEIVAAIEARDGDRAAAALSTHLMSAKANQARLRAERDTEQSD
ncbi:GntR family transcriptional regulator [Tropicimonas sp. IMCC6043]|uniref:GntR family transcriptional regulator n=1 Tax=Tropicimonas sp. IMCC6043 TaxID=2510645 RepID=UPI00101B7917|nr:GntR family transcriptional regulator [Tropicimonas sp. IMCC6043]RYH07912.1 GntR family transcriptional regulator [Tropicimonas sp. IMCC6043]